MAENSAATLEQQRVPTPAEFNAVIEAAQKGSNNRILPAEEKEQNAEVIFERTVVINGQSLKFQGATPEAVLDQVTAAVTAAGTVKQPEDKKETAAAKPALTEKDIFDIGVKIQKGDVKALDEYLDKSDYVGRKLAEQGINVVELKQATRVALDSQTAQSWESATDEFLKMPGNDWPGGEQNQELLGMMIARMKLTPSAANIKLAYDELKSKDMLFPGAANRDNKQTVRRATSSTAFGTSGRVTSQSTSTSNAPSISKSAFDSAKSQQERDALYNKFVREGGDPKKPNWVA